MKINIISSALALGLLLMMPALLRADTFGSGADAFEISFAPINNPGNPDDAGAGGGTISSPFGGVSYSYRMGIYEISQALISKATNLGMTNVTAGAWLNTQPAADMTWYEAAAFVNWLNTSKGYQAAYDLSWSGSAWTIGLWTSAQAWQLGGENRFRHKDAYYFLPSFDEWYKAAYHKNDGVTANYWDYATASNTLPTAVSSGTAAGTVVWKRSSPAGVDSAGGLSAYGIMGMNGNIAEWTESAVDGTNDLPGESIFRSFGNFYTTSNTNLVLNVGESPLTGSQYIGFRVASIPEPSAALLVVSGLAAFIGRRRRESVL